MAADVTVIQDRGRRSVWVCSRCTLENDCEANKCNACDAPRRKQRPNGAVAASRSESVAESLNRFVEARMRREKVRVNK